MAHAACPVSGPRETPAHRGSDTGWGTTGRGPDRTVSTGGRSVATWACGRRHALVAAWGSRGPDAGPTHGLLPLPRPPTHTARGLALPWAPVPPQAGCCPPRPLGPARLPGVVVTRGLCSAFHSRWLRLRLAALRQFGDSLAACHRSCTDATTTRESREGTGGKGEQRGGVRGGERRAVNTPRPRGRPREPPVPRRTEKEGQFPETPERADPGRRDEAAGREAELGPREPLPPGH